MGKRNACARHGTERVRKLIEDVLWIRALRVFPDKFSIVVFKIRRINLNTDLTPITESRLRVESCGFWFQMEV